MKALTRNIFVETEDRELEIEVVANWTNDGIGVYEYFKQRSELCKQTSITRGGYQLGRNVK